MTKKKAEKTKQKHYFTLETAKTKLTRAEVMVFQNLIEQTLRKTGFAGDVKYMGYLTSPAESWEN
jgi:hypothetical protein